MLHFEGDRTFSLPPAELWTKLSDARFLVDCIPGVESVSEREADHTTCVLRPGFAFVRGTLELTLRVTEAVAGNMARLQLQTKGIGSTSAVGAAMTFAPHDGGAQVHWTADVTELGGLLKAVPQGLIKAAAQKVIADAWDAVEKRVQAA
jgi:carbon monoxide dehydrogenase subunit G